MFFYLKVDNLMQSNVTFESGTGLIKFKVVRELEIMEGTLSVAQTRWCISIQQEGTGELGHLFQLLLWQ